MQLKICEWGTVIIMSKSNSSIFLGMEWTVCASLHVKVFVINLCMHPFFPEYWKRFFFSLLFFFQAENFPKSCLFDRISNGRNCCSVDSCSCTCMCLQFYLQFIWLDVQLFVPGYRNCNVGMFFLSSRLIFILHIIHWLNNVEIVNFPFPIQLCWCFNFPSWVLLKHKKMLLLMTLQVIIYYNAGECVVVEVSWFN